MGYITELKVACDEWHDNPWDSRARARLRALLERSLTAPLRTARGYKIAVETACDTAHDAPDDITALLALLHLLSADQPVRPRSVGSR